LLRRRTFPALALAAVALGGPFAGRPAGAQAQGAPAPSGSEGEPQEEEPSASASASAPPLPSATPSVPAPAPMRPHANIPLQDGMLRLPGGRFTMGSADPKSPPNERPAHVETVGPFWIDRTEVTVGAYRECVEKNVCQHPARSSATCTYDQGDALLPVSCVRWIDADTYCHASMKRLPREVEWEYAARGTSKSRFPWGGAASNCAVAATLLHDATGRSCSGKRPSRVGAHPMGASTFGVMDLTGNVEEWTSDWYSESVAGGAAPAAGASHVLRGGGWLSTPSMSRTTSRNWGSNLEAGPNVGFRCARDDEPGR
jgi:formylglycine-generating enzyme required for sulfatase activity